ncbi:hypothetical protein Phum_PHUM398630 [Pediculus humanus corporis]|uniref:Uncharacterized protein n=1 Tax=Pediculus humanus subsp. corporis TaxID=121224 RepID=E0VRI2_PEDHC|nr:uncharacterized protein Phum_PHUM398630 [Pediculus humanus corporis]EEB15988.1 hypothetical protein Phum_PHUM398630 [Pediculus humanus corporis]
MVCISCFMWPVLFLLWYKFIYPIAMRIWSAKPVENVKNNTNLKNNENDKNWNCDSKYQDLSSSSVESLEKLD